MGTKYYKRDWGWVLSANVGEGLPYAIVNTLLVAMLADLGMDAAQVTLITGGLILPWSLKFLWSPMVEAVGTKRRWMLAMELCLAAVFLLTAIALSSGFWEYFIVILATLAAIFSATYDISCDGFYMKALDDDAQSFFVGIRNMAYRCGLLIATGGMVWLAGKFQSSGIAMTSSWQLTFTIIGVIFLLFWAISHFILPKNERPSEKSIATGYVESIKNFFTKQSLTHLLFLLLFIFTYRLGESFLSKITLLFLKDSAENGGIGLNNEQCGFLYGTLGVLALTVGGVLGGIYISRFSLKKSIIPMALALNVPDLLYVWLAKVQPTDLSVIGTCISVEQFGFGFGLTAYTVYLLQHAKGEYSTAHYAFLTALMAVGLAIPSMISGKWQLRLGYEEFFIRTCWLTLPGIAMSVIYAFLPSSERFLHKKTRKNQGNSDEKREKRAKIKKIRQNHKKVAKKFGGYIKRLYLCSTLW